MSLKEFQREPDGTLWPRAGWWVPVKHEGDPTARCGCPGCGTISSMYDHTIDAAGRVTPSVGCPGPRGNACYHETGVVLLGWP